MPLTFRVSVQLGMLCRYETGSNEVVSSIWSKLTQGLDGNGCRRGVWQRLWAPLSFHVSIGLAMLYKHGMSSNELVACIWRRVDAGNI